MLAGERALSCRIKAKEKDGNERCDSFDVRGMNFDTFYLIGFNSASA